MIEQIGQGGGGHLYLARDLELGGVWAVKEIPLTGKKEAKLLRLLEHPALPKMVDYVEREEFCYLVMEYIRGKSLGQWLQEGRHFSLEEIVQIGISAAQVLGYLHTRKPPVYYGDLKPDNLMLTEEGRLCLVDLGSAVIGYPGLRRTCLGTKGYAAPEQYQGRIGAASDIYGMGKTLEKLCGKNRWKYTVFRPSFGYLLLKCCYRQEKRRYENMGQVEKELRRILKAKPQMHTGLLAGTAILAGALAAGWGVSHREKAELPFQDAVSMVTDLYYDEAFRKGGDAEQQEICRRAEKKLQQLQKKYKKAKEQERLLLLLAYNGELLGKNDHASLYYEQLLLYHGEFQEAYGEYGLYLGRKGKHPESLTLWEDWKREKQKKGLKSPEEGNLKIWEKRVGEWKRAEQ